MEIQVLGAPQLKCTATRSPWYFAIRGCQENIKHSESLTRAQWLLTTLQGSIFMAAAELGCGNKMRIPFLPTLPQIC